MDLIRQYDIFDGEGIAGNGEAQGLRQGGRLARRLGFKADDERIGLRFRQPEQIPAAHVIGIEPYVVAVDRVTVDAVAERDLEHFAVARGEAEGGFLAVEIREITVIFHFALREKVAVAGCLRARAVWRHVVGIQDAVQLVIWHDGLDIARAVGGDHIRGERDAQAFLREAPDAQRRWAVKAGADNLLRIGEKVVAFITQFLRDKADERFFRVGVLRIIQIVKREPLAGFEIEVVGIPRMHRMYAAGIGDFHEMQTERAGSGICVVQLDCVPGFHH